MTTVAVTAASSPVGRAVLERLDAEPSVSRIVAIDVTAPPMPVAKLEVRHADLRDRLLHLQLRDVDTLVHLACHDELDFDLDTRFAHTVGATRNLLTAVGRAGVRRLVHRSSAMVYGAHPDNPVPLTEARPRRANADFPPAHHHRLAEELVEDFAEANPDVTVTVLRPANVLGPGERGWLSQHLEAPRLLTVRGQEPPLQLVHVDDLADAAARAALDADVRGVCNVAAEGWLPLADVAAVLGRRRLAVPEAWAYATTRALWRRGWWPLPPGALPLLTEPWVVRSDRLHEVGWAPERSNREVLREFAAEHAAWMRLGRWRVRRRTLRLAAAGTVALPAVAWLARRRLAR